MPGLMDAQIAGGTLFLMSVMVSLEEVGISISKLSNEDIPSPMWWGGVIQSIKSPNRTKARKGYFVHSLS